MKAGDFLYCKQTYQHINIIDNVEEWVTKGKCYKIVYDENCAVYSIIDNDGDMNNTLLLPNLLKIYFLTQQEYRKLKLEKLNEKR